MLDLGRDLRHSENEIIILWFLKGVEDVFCDLVAEIVINEQISFWDEIEEAVLPQRDLCFRERAVISHHSVADLVPFFF